MKNTTSYKALFDNIAPRYEQAMLPIFAPLAADLVAWLEPQPHDNVLDMGTGTGIVSRYLAPHVQTCIGLDFSFTMLEVAQSLTPSPFVQGDAHRLPFATNTFDLVIASFGLNATQPRQSLREIYRVLKPGARLCFQEWGGWHAFDELVTNTINEFSVADEDASPELLAWRDFFGEERQWFQDLQTEADYRLDLTEYGFGEIEAQEYCPLAIQLPVDVFLRYRTGWTGMRSELAAMDESARADCLDSIRAQLYEAADASGILTYDPLIFRIRARKG